LATVGSLVVNLTSDYRGLTKGTQSAIGVVRKFGTDANSVVAGVAGSLAGTVGKLTGMLGGGGLLAGIGFGVKYAADAEQASIAFTTMIGDAKKAESLLGDLKKFAAETPFQLPEVRDAGRNLLAMGFSAAQVIPNLKMIGDIAAGTTQPLGELADVFTKIKSDGKLMGDQLNRLTGRGIPVISEFAKMFGKPESAIRKMVEEGQISFAHLQRAFQNMTSVGGKFYNMTAAQSKTLAGQFSNLKDNVSSALGAIGQVLIDGFDIKGIVKNVADFASTFQTTFAPLLATITTFIAENRKLIAIVAGVAGAAVTLATGWVVLGPVFVGVAGALGGLISVIAGLALGPIGAAAAAVLGIGVAFAYAYGEGDTFSERVGSSLAWVWAKVQDLATAIPDMIDAASFAFRNFGDIAQLSIVNVGIAALEMFPQMIGPLQEVASVAAGLWAGAKAGFSSFIQNVVAGAMEIKNMFAALWEGAKAAWDAIKGGNFSGAAAAFGDAFSGALAAQEDVRGGGNPADAFAAAFVKAGDEVRSDFDAHGGLLGSLRETQQGLLGSISARESERNAGKDAAEASAESPAAEAVQIASAAVAAKTEQTKTAAVDVTSTAGYSAIKQGLDLLSPKKDKLEDLAKQQIAATQQVKTAIVANKPVNVVPVTI